MPSAKSHSPNARCHSEMAGRQLEFQTEASESLSVPLSQEGVL